ncbi:MAG: hypothetical protein JNN31_07275 [Dechloromonas sp.]|nr:hypothetical protein [Dechloromonas sp.]
MNTKDVSAAPTLPWWSRHPHFLLAGHLLLLHALAFGGWQSPAVRILWFVALGLFLLWQPFVAGEQRMNPRQGAVLLGIALASTWLLGPWLMLVWCGALGAVIGGRVLWTGSRIERTGYLVAFGYLVCLTIFGVVPEISPAVVLDPLPRQTLGLYMPAALVLLLAFPASPQRRQAGDAFDLFYGMLVFLALAVFVLGALAFTLVGGVSYVEALVMTSLSIAAALLVLAWAWNPRAGFSGIGSALSRYLLSVGLPLEQWLVKLAEASERETHPVRFLATVTEQLDRMPWVVGGSWQAGVEAGEFGIVSAHIQEYRRNDVVLTLYFRYPPSPAMHWHVEWLLRLATEFYLVKFQTHELQRMGYLQAVYETGARVTHDVKNLLQSLQTLCYAASQPGDPAAVTGLLARQLPQITERLKATLDKLQRPQIEESRSFSALTWWERLQDRHAGDGIAWQEELRSDTEVPITLFDSIAENLLQNALSKRQREGGLEISAKFAVDRNRACFSVRDSGEAITPAIAESLLRAPVQSEFGMGIGLYHAAKQAEESGYALKLAENKAGAVTFTLAPKG